jgi:hypothetical protein
MEFENMIIFQAYDGSNNTRCIMISKNNTTTQLYSELDKILFPRKRHHINSIYNPDLNYNYNNALMNDQSEKKPYKLYALSFTLNKTLYIPNKCNINIGEFIRKNSRYFMTSTNVRTIHPLYKIYIIDESVEKMWHSSKNKSLSDVCYEKFQRLTSCFG